MVKWLFKYGVVLFLFNTVLLSIESTRSFGNQFFLTLMFVYLIVLLINPQQIKNILFHKAFSFFLILNLLNLFYFIVFHSFTDREALEYLLARGMVFSMISLSIYFHYEYYKTNFLYHLALFIVFVVFVGLIFNPNIFSGRYSGIVWNPNMLSSFTTIAFGVLFLNNTQRTRFDTFLVFVLLVVSLSTGSRGVLIAIVLVFLFKYGFSNRNVLYAFLACLGYFIIINFQLDTSINRIASQSLFNDRLFQYQYAYETILQKPFVGFGLDKYAYINPKLIPYHLRGHIISAHNGYLAILTQYGIIFGSVILFIIFKKSFQVVNCFRKSLDIEKTYLFLITYALFASVYETLMTGINEFHTVLFWFSLAFLSFSKFKQENED
ncbi:MAG: O-antigen ligase family protein [Bacteroidota bacterium]|nr:O-antigen ligase family protein [Bacteroidota bacterium]